ncbi:elongation factor 1-gamma [Cylindrobasidium torrendii FP15055 ss-10]|uniref:Elongation factor 1-gamma n=1 Tax=Cylindrobasidium torrendii FP15055 ss-10 TaxID=1314674 RepID=A0A0D7B7K1_9AGAR|nr:elongation factor 1-gamma [Cylindrobasidium torrendii FP15055 ss-10]
MSTPTLWTIPIQAKGKPIRAALTLAGIPFELPTGYEHFKSNLEPAFKGKFPHGKIPAWEEGSLLLFEADAILRYVAKKAPNGGLTGSSPVEEAQIDQWIHFVDTEIDANNDLVRALAGGKIPYSKPAHTWALDREIRGLTTLNLHLASRTFLVGERLTIADLFVAALIQKATTATLDSELRAKFPHTIRHLETVANQPAIKAIYDLNPSAYIEKGITFVPPKKEAKPKAEKKKEEPKPKAPKKKAEEEDDDEPPADVPPEEKKRNPLDDLPKSNFNLEDWKRAYSNLDTRGAEGSLEWFYKNYDPAGFSLWRVDFKYNEELTQTFMSSNQIGGFFNRLEASRKYLFGSVGVLGETNNSVISGSIITRGPEIEPTISVAPDWESYSYTKIDLEKPEDKAFFEASLAWDLEIDGKKWADGKNFK